MSKLENTLLISASSVGRVGQEPDVQACLPRFDPRAEQDEAVGDDPADRDGSALDRVLARSRLVQHAVGEKPEPRDHPAKGLQVLARLLVLGSAEPVGHDRRVRLGHDERLDELMGSSGRERLDLGLLLLQLLDTGREPVHFQLERKHSTGSPVQWVR